MDTYQSFLSLGQHPYFPYYCILAALTLLYLIYVLKYRHPYFLFKGEYDVSKKNIKKTPPPYPNGWYNAAKSKDLPPGGVKAVDLNG